MIFYFTGTGNSRWVAEQLAAALGDETYDMAECMRSGVVPVKYAPGEKVGVVFPVHSWKAPLPVLRFLSRLNVPAGIYCYAVCTCGDDAGKAMKSLSRVFNLDAAWSVRMPNTYVPMFQLDSDELAFSKINAARVLIPEIAKSVSGELCEWKVYEGSLPWVKSYILNPLFHRFLVRTRGFHTDEGCTSCGTCVRLCPMGNIHLEHGRPAWGKECIHCMACLHGCPSAVIQYGKSTREKGRYRLSRYLR